MGTSPGWICVPNPSAWPAALFALLHVITILNRSHHFRGFVYQYARFASGHKSIEIAVRPRKGSVAICSRCHQPAPVTINSLSGATNSSLCWGFWFFCGTRCAA